MRCACCSSTPRRNWRIAADRATSRPARSSARASRSHDRTAAGGSAAAAGRPFGTPETRASHHARQLRRDCRLLPGAEEAEHLSDMRSRDRRRLFAQARTLMASRRERGFVRECHGDLHCGNVVRWQRRLVPFDGLEFDPALRFIDVANDLAFLSMDLGAHARPDLRRELLNAWTAASGDYEAVELLPYYEGYRALVRAKVAALRRQQARGTCRCGLDDARAPVPGVGTPPDAAAPSVTLRDGGVVRQPARPGSRPASPRRATPSTCARTSNASGSPAWGRWTRRIRHLTAASTRRHSTSARTPGCSECVEACLAGNESVLVDAANLRRHEREEFLQIAAKYRAAAIIVHCTAPLDRTQGTRGAPARVGDGCIRGDRGAAGPSTCVLGTARPRGNGLRAHGRYE